MPFVSMLVSNHKESPVDKPNPFYSQPLTDDQLAAAKEIRDAYDALHTLLETALPHSREASVAKTQLETSSMWAVKAISHNPPQE